MSAIFYMIVFAGLVTIGVMVAGGVAMARGGSFDDNYSASLMEARVITQAIAVGLIIVALLFWA